MIESEQNLYGKNQFLNEQRRHQVLRISLGTNPNITEIAEISK